jgi:hypothetical protein
VRGVAALLGGLLCLFSASAASALPGSGPRETIDQRYTAKKPNKPTGAAFTGVYHAANDPKGNPPYMRRMTFYPPHGMRFDTSVPERCTASDLELELNGMGACPAGSRLGGGKTSGIFYEPIAHSFSSPYENTLDIVNNANEQIMLIKAPVGYVVVRGRVRPNQAVEFASPTCFPAPPAGQQCAVDHVLQTGSDTSMGRHGRYAVTPPTCPKRRYWRTHVKFWWADGSVDDVASDQPCRRR